MRSLSPMAQGERESDVGFLCSRQYPSLVPLPTPPPGCWLPLPLFESIIPTELDPRPSPSPSPSPSLPTWSTPLSHQHVRVGSAVQPTQPYPMSGYAQRMLPLVSRCARCARERRCGTRSQVSRDPTEMGPREVYQGRGGGRQGRSRSRQDG
ncbi:hypothetical protein IE53DRAFT_132069 [Violaceomyces palustris]|uniref:Uncharacterized protein n=1 Tax=Violaceomyces palustris TaxID=1673888 RepID=A0ACD0NV30_9BASI|nr:hypothetical protein IE53DRAFT_132069 [Violaceomyces palustris]